MKSNTKKELPAWLHGVITICPVLNLAALMALTYGWSIAYWPFQPSPRLQVVSSFLNLAAACLCIYASVKTTPVSKRQLLNQLYEAETATKNAYRAAPIVVPRHTLVGYEQQQPPEYTGSWKSARRCRDWWRREHDRFITYVNQGDPDWDHSKLYYHLG